MHPVKVTLWVFVALGVALILTYLLFSRRRSYLLYIGLGIISSALAIMAQPGKRWLLALLALMTFILAVYEGLLDTRERLRRFREEQREREAAFSDFMHEIVKKDQLTQTVKQLDRPKID